MPSIDFHLTKERLYKRAFAVTSPGEHLKRASAAGDLRKCLGPWELTFLGTGSIIGAGVFVLSGVAANESAGYVCIGAVQWRCEGCVTSAKQGVSLLVPPAATRPHSHTNKLSCLSVAAQPLSYPI